MKKRRARNNTEAANFVIGCEDACWLEQEIHAIMDDEPINLDHLELRLREAIGAVKRVRDSGLGNKALYKQLNGFEKYCNSVLQTIVGHPH
jgi:hypothetical protein